MCGCSQMTTTTMELPSLVCLCVLISCGVSSADANEPVKVVVKEDSDAILPCSLSTKENIESKLFDWKKDGQKEVFLFNSGPQYNNNPLDGQDRQFRGRVFHFQDELKHGNASIIIRNTTVTDSGNYTCIFPRLQPSQTFHIELVVVGAASEPYATTIKRDNEVLLQCRVLGVFPKPEVEWKDSSGNIVPAEEPKITERGGRYDVILQAAVTKADNFHCVVTQKEIYHQIYAEIYVPLGAASKPSVKPVQTKDGMKLQCEVFGAFPQPEVEWKDSSGNTVPGEEPKITQRGDKYDIILEAPVTKTDHYWCVVTQKEIDHQTENDISVTIGAASEPLVTILKRDNEVLLQCVVLDVSPKTEVEWKDSSGNIVPAEEPKITDREGSYDINLQAPVTKTDNFRCIVTQKEIDHQIYAEIYATHGDSTGWIVAAVLGVLLVAAVVVLLRKRLCKKSQTENPPPEGEKRPMNSDSHRPVD